MKIHKKIKVIILSTLGMAMVATPFSSTAYLHAIPATIYDIKNKFKNLTPQTEAKLAKTMTIENDKIKIGNDCVTNLKKTNLRILTVRLTVYWARGTGSDSDSKKLRSSTGYTLKQGDSIAVDPRIIPYNSEVLIPNIGMVRAVDTGTAVVNKVASHGKLPIIDVFFLNKSDAERFACTSPKVVKVAVFN